MRRLRERRERETKLVAMQQATHEAEKAQALARSAAEGKKLLRIIEHVIGIGAGLAAIAGVLFWFYEAGDRDEERSARRAELVARAQTILTSIDPQEEIDSYDNPLIEWAIVTLARYDQPIFIKAKTVSLIGIELECAKISVEADSLRLPLAELSGVTLSWTGRNLDMDKTVGHSVSLYLSMPIEDRKAFVENEFVITTQGNSWQKELPANLSPPIKVSMDNARFVDLRIVGVGMSNQTAATISTAGTIVKELELGFSNSYFKFPSLAQTDATPTLPPTGCREVPDHVFKQFQCAALGNSNVFDDDSELRDASGEAITATSCLRW
jgi:hypothetical protein